MIIETERLILRPFTENDAADAFCFWAQRSAQSLLNKGEDH